MSTLEDIDFRAMDSSNTDCGLTQSDNSNLTYLVDHDDILRNIAWLLVSWGVKGKRLSAADTKIPRTEYSPTTCTCALPAITGDHLWITWHQAPGACLAKRHNIRKPFRATTGYWCGDLG